MSVCGGVQQATEGLTPPRPLGWTVEYTPVGTWVRRPAIFGGGKKKKKKKGKAEEEEEEEAAA